MKQQEQPMSSMTVGAGLVTQRQSTMSVAKPVSSIYLNKLKQHENPLGQEFIIHRSANCTIYNNYQDEMQRRLQREHDLKTKGWFSKEQIPYQQLGDFSNILQAVESVKQNLPHTRQHLDDSTIRNLKFLRKVQDPHQVVLQEPGRTIKILRQYQGQLNKIRANSSVDTSAGFSGVNRFLHSNAQMKESQKKTQGALSFLGMNDDEEEEKYRQLQILRHRNGSINSPSLKQLITSSVDGRSVLKSEIVESNNRLLQIKHGMGIEDIVRKHLNAPINTDDLLSPRSEAQDFKTEAMKGRDSKLRKSMDSSLYMSKKASSEMDQSVKRKAAIRTSYQSTTQSPLAMLRNPNPVLIPLNPPPAKDGLPPPQKQVFNSEGVIFIPNYLGDRKAKIIKMAELATIIVPKKSTDSTATNSQANSIADLTNMRKSIDASNRYNDSPTKTNKRSQESGDPTVEISFKLPSQRLNAIGSMWKKPQNAANPASINYHKKLKDEFERYERFMREQTEHLEGTYMSQQISHANKSAHIRQMIANQFLNLKLKKSSKDNFEDNLERDSIELNAQQVESLKEELQVVPSEKPSEYPPGRQRKSKYSIKSKQQPFMTQGTFRGSVLQPNSSLEGTQSKAKRPLRLSRFERDQMLITAIINSIRGPAAEDLSSEDESVLLAKMSDDYLWKECTTLLKEYFNIDFLNELKDNKQIMFRLYKLYLLHQLMLRMKAIEDNPNHPANKRKGGGKSSLMAQSQIMASSINGEPMVYEEYSDDEMDLAGEDGTGEEGDAKKYRGLDKDEIYKHKMNSFIRLLQDILNPVELPEARELDSVFQLKAQVRAYYEKKGELSDNLTETLYAMMMERDTIIETKKKYFFSTFDREANPDKPLVERLASKQTSSPSNLDQSDIKSPLDTPTHSKAPVSPKPLDKDLQSVKHGSQVKKVRNLYFELEQMRLKSERDRISSYREMVEALIHNSTQGIVKKSF